MFWKACRGFCLLLFLVLMARGSRCNSSVWDMQRCDMWQLFYLSVLSLSLILSLQPEEAPGVGCFFGAMLCVFLLDNRLL